MSTSIRRQTDSVVLTSSRQTAALREEVTLSIFADCMGVKKKFSMTRIQNGACSRESSECFVTLEQGPIAMVVYTVGHSVHPIEEFIRILQAYGIRLLVDVRTIPKSRRNPQFSRENLPGSLQTAGIQYRHLPGLGGLRHPRKDSANTGWRNASFRGYADYMQTPAFGENLNQLTELAASAPTAIMCAEAVPWRCHRSLIADALVARGIAVTEIFSATKSQPHALTPFAIVKGEQVTYPGKADSKATSLDLPLFSQLE
jgi:Domain of unknown function DUF488